MAKDQQGTTARGANKKSGSRKRAASQSASRNAVDPKPAAATPKKAASRKKAAPKRTSKKAAASRQVSAEERYRMIQEAAYFRAEKEGFECDPWQCWLVAEAEVDAQLARPR